MVLIWNGRGIVVFFIFIAACFVAIPATVIVLAPYFSLNDDRAFNLSVAVAAFLSAIASYSLDRFIMKQPEGGSTAVDPKTGHSHVVRNRDSLIFIETRYWTYIFAALTVVMVAVTFLFSID
jgi:hypothetical protein